MSLLLLFVGARIASTTTATATATSSAVTPVFFNNAQGIWLPAPGSPYTSVFYINTIKQLASGGSNSKGSFTLSSTGATLLSVSNVNCGVNSIITMSPGTADAAAQRATVYTLSSNVGKGSFSVSQASNTSTDSTFNYVIHS